MESLLTILNKFPKLPKELLVVVAMLSILAVMIVPLPSFILDFFLVISIALGLLILLTSVYIQNPSSLTMFPTLILVVTLFRLALNVATTRTILAEGHNGPEAVSQIITSFGNFVVGGNFAIGFVIFVILVLINFMVITKGSTRVAEVSARFTLDSLPGKQMAIDQDLQQGYIDDKEAKSRRDALGQETDFYGAMDGSSKFVKGDAVAGIIITGVNIIVGFAIGMFQHNMDAAASAQIYTLLTIGDGLVSQIPALLLSTATGILITKSTRDSQSFASGVTKQMSQDFQTYFIVGIVMLAATLVPGFPKGTLVFMGMLLIIFSFLLYKKAGRRGFGVFDAVIHFFERNEFFSALGEALASNSNEPQLQTAGAETRSEAAQDTERPEEPKEEEGLINTNALELSFGYQLVTMANEGPLLEKLKGIRKTIAESVGFVIPQIKVGDDPSLRSNEYSLKLKGVEVFRNTVEPKKLLAIPGLGSTKIDGAIPVKDPIYNMDAFWIGLRDKEEAIVNDYTIIEVPSLIVSHVMEEVKRHATEIITRQDIVGVMDVVKKTHPVIVEDVLKNANYGLVLRVVKELLTEGIPINDMVTILEVIADITEYTGSVDIIVSNLRQRLYRVITDLYKSETDGFIHIITLEPATEAHLLNQVEDNNGNPQLLLSVPDIQELITVTKEEKENLERKGIHSFALVVDPSLRKMLFDVYKQFRVEIGVVSLSELNPAVPFNVEGHIKLNLENQNPQM